MAFLSSLPSAEPVELAREAVKARRIGQLARIGYAAIGIVYMLIAVLALAGVFGAGGQYTGTEGAARTVLAQPFGKTLLGLITAGLATYVLWRMAQALFDVEDRGRSSRGFARRFGLLLSGLSYAGLAIVAGEYVITGTGTVEDPKMDLTAQLMHSAAGQVVAGILGAVIIGVGLFQFRGTYQAGFVDYIHTEPFGKWSQRMLTTLARLGLFSRGIVFVIIGGFTIAAAWHSNASELRGIGGVLRLMNRQPYGEVMIAVLALGLFAFGFFKLLESRYRHILPEDATVGHGEQTSGDESEEGKQEVGEASDPAEAPTANEAVRSV